MSSQYSAQDAGCEASAMLAGRSILVVSYHFYPSPAVGAKRPSELVRALQNNGAKVAVLRCCGSVDEWRQGIREIKDVHYVDVKPAKRRLSKLWVWLKNKRRVKVVRALPSDLAVSDSGDKSAFSGLGLKARETARSIEALFGGEKSWLLRALSQSYSLRHRQFDIVFASGPVSCAYVLGYILAKRHASRLILDFRDPWHVQGDTDTYPTRAKFLLAKLESRVRRQVVELADLITVASPGIERHVLRTVSQKLPEIRLVLNGFDSEMRIDEAPPSGLLRMLYAGTLYLNRNPFPLFEALKELIELGQIDRSLATLTFVGDCKEWQGHSTEKWIEDNGLGDVIHILGLVSPEKIREMTIQSNVLINLAQGQPDQIPAKTYEYLASGRDVLLFAEADSDSARIQTDTGLGEVVCGDDLEDIKRAVLLLFKKHCEGKTLHISNAIIDLDRYSRVTMNREFICAIEQVLEDS